MLLMSAISGYSALDVKGPYLFLRAAMITVNLRWVAWPRWSCSQKIKHN